MPCEQPCFFRYGLHFYQVLPEKEMEAFVLVPWLVLRKNAKQVTVVIVQGAEAFGFWLRRIAGFVSGGVLPGRVVLP